MKMQRKATVVGALMIAGGAIVTGASVTSQALAAEDTSADAPVSAVVIGSATADGDAYQCVFDGVDLPAPSGDLPVLDGVAVAGAGGVEVGETAPLPVAGDGGGVEFSVSVGADGAAGAVAAVPTDGGVLIEVGPGEQGAVTVSESGEVVIGATGIDGEAVTAAPIEVREGSPEECDALLDGMPALPEPPTSTPAP